MSIQQLKAEKLKLLAKLEAELPDKDAMTIPEVTDNGSNLNARAADMKLGWQSATDRIRTTIDKLRLEL